MRDELSHDILRFLDKIEISSLLKSKHWLSGRHLSRIKGDSPEFKEFREWQDGESIRLVDWKSSARQQKRLIRERDHQGTLDHYIIVDRSPSMDFPNAPNDKFTKQKFLIGLILYLIQSQGDPFTMVHDSKTGPWVGERQRGSEALHRSIGHLAQLEIHSQSNVGACLEHLRQRLKKPSFIWHLSDWDSPPESALHATKQLQTGGHHIKALHLYHPWELELPWSQLTHFKDLEEQYPDLVLDTSDLKNAFREEMGRHLETIEDAFLAMGIEFCSIDLMASPEQWLGRLFLNSKDHALG
jgi:uncharacterized protein (DUF58 family)